MEPGDDAPALDEAGLADPAPAGAGSPPIPRNRRGLRKLVGPVILAGLFALAALVSWQLHDPAENNGKDPNPSSEGKSPGNTFLPSASPAELLARADVALNQHRFGLALSLYEDLLASSSAHASVIEYRLALCHEAIGQTDRAIAGYRTTISAAPTPALAFASHLGLARCLFGQGRFAEVRALLEPFLLDEARQRDLPRPFSADARYLVALALSRDAAACGLALATPPEVRGQKSDDGPVSISAIGLEIPFYLDETGPSPGTLKQPAAVPKEAAAPPAAGAGKEPKSDPMKPILLKKQADGRAVLIRRVELNRPAIEVIELLAAESGLSIKLSADARKTLTERSLTICLHDVPFDELLECIADHCGLAFRVDGKVRQLCMPAEFEAKQLTAWNRDRAVRALRSVLLTDAAHAWMPAACLEIGNWEAALGKLPEAGAWYERLVREAPNSPCVPAAYFNLALVHLQQQDVAAARTDFFRVIDHSPGHDLALKVHVRIGITHLQDEEFAEGIVHLRHALAMAQRSPVEAHATVALAAGYLLNKQPELARTVLARQPKLLLKNPCKTTAAFLDAYAKYQLAHELNPARREASDLLSTLWRDEDQTVLGSLGDYLVAQAYRDLGFWSNAEKILRATGGHTRGTLARAVQFSLADTLIKEQQRDEGTKLFEKLAAEPSVYRPRAQFQLAQVRLQARQFKECVALCGEMWKERADLDSKAVLQTWGAGLEGMGDFARAARCYAGKPPD